MAEPQRNLIFARVGDRSLHGSWRRDAPADRSWDLQLSAYGEDESRVQDGDLPLSIDRGTKWDSVLRYFTERPECLDRYAYVFFPDDDLVMDPRAFDRLFQTCREFGLLVAQPALDPKSYFSKTITLQCPDFRLRFVTYVEPMAPVIRTSYLKTLLPVLEKTRSGWGLDFLWAVLMEDPPFRAAVIDEVPVHHSRPLYTGELYAYLKARMISPSLDMKQLLASYEGLPRGLNVYGGILRDGRRVAAAEACRRNGLHLLKSAHRTRNRRVAAWTGLGMLVRSVTRKDFVPKTARRRPSP
jgi:hypothetical protein